MTIVHPGQPLSDREIEVMRLVAKGFSSRQIGRELFVSYNTIKSHLQRIYVKIGARNAAHAVELTHDLRKAAGGEQR